MSDVPPGPLGCPENAMNEPSRRSALEGHYRIGRFGARSGDGRGIVLAQCRPRALVQINGAPDAAVLAGSLGGTGAGAAPNRSFRAGEVAYMWNGPGRWLAESDAHPPHELVERIEAALGPHGASATDLSHARTVLRVSGAAAEDLLAKLCPIDVEAMRTGESAVTLAGPFHVQVVRSGDEEFRLYVFRSFGLAMWELLCDEAAEFGAEVVPGG